MLRMMVPAVLWDLPDIKQVYGVQEQHSTAAGGIHLSLGDCETKVDGRFASRAGCKGDSCITEAECGRGSGE